MQLHSTQSLFLTRKLSIFNSDVIKLSPFNFSVYEQSGCSQLIGVGGQANDYCFQVNDNPVNSIEWKWPKGYSYATTDCTGTPLGSVTFSTTCESPDPTDIDDYVFYNSYTQFSYSSAFSNLSFGFGVLFSTILVALQLIKN